MTHEECKRLAMLAEALVRLDEAHLQLEREERPAPYYEMCARRPGYLDETTFGKIKLDQATGLRMISAARALICAELERFGVTP